MKEYFVYTVSDPAPICGDEAFRYETEASPQAALTRVMLEYRHPRGLHYVAVYESADAYHKHAEPLSYYKHPNCKFIGG